MIEVFFATNRAHTGPDDAPVFGNRPIAVASQDFRVGTAWARREGNAYRFDRAVLEPETIADDDAASVLGSRALFTRVRDRLRAQPTDVVVFVHGFNSTFASAIERAAELTEKYLVPAADVTERDRPGLPPSTATVEPLVVPFAWPSDGQAQPRRKYFDDRADAAEAGRSMARAVLRLCEYLRTESRRRVSRAGEAPASDEICARRFHLVAHSMGVYVLRHALSALVEQAEAPREAMPFPRRLPRLFHHAFLMAADEDEDAFAHPAKLGRLPELAANVHVYHSAHDRALAVSDYTKNNPPRLGQDGPVTLDGLDDRIDAVDCREVDETETFGDGAHQYYRKRVEVVEDVRAVLGDVPGPLVPDRVALGANRYRIRGR